MEPTIINSEALDRLDEWGGSDLVRQMVRLFLQNTPGRIEQVQAAFEDDPGNLPERGAHSLKSSAANVGAEGVRKVAAEIEMAAQSGDYERVRALTPELTQAFQEATRALEEILRGHPE